jgi:hypothetical protein
MEQRLTPKTHRFCLWMGVVMTVVYLIGFIPLAHYWPVPTPDWDSQRLADWLVANRGEFQIGCALMIAGAGLFAPWGSALAIWTRHTEARFPVLYTAQIVALAAGFTIFVVIQLFWAIASFRAGQVDPDITQTMFDVGWFMFLFDIPAFIAWSCALALGILWNPPEHQRYPRWSGYFTLAVTLCWAAGLLVVFFHSGAFSYNGLLAMWLPLGAFFVWLAVMTYLGFRAIAQQEAACRAEQDPALGVYVAPSVFTPEPEPSDGHVASPPDGIPVSARVKAGVR